MLFIATVCGEICDKIICYNNLFCILVSVLYKDPEGLLLQKIAI